MEWRNLNELKIKGLDLRVGRGDKKDGLPSFLFVVARTKIQLISAIYLDKQVIGLDFSAPLHFGRNDQCLVGYEQNIVTSTNAERSKRVEKING